MNSPAKLNLFFRLLSKRPDGYHEIASLFQAIDLCDRLFVSFSSKDEITCSDPTIPTGGANLVFRAISLFRERYPLPPVQVHIEKNIPVQAGLGGGSSNAATALFACNELLGKPASLQELIQMGSQIGSDVPFFFSTGTAYCTGKGEILEPFVLPAPLRGWIAKPSFGLATPLVYQHVRLEDLSLCDPRKSLRDFPEFFNDLEAPSFRLEPRLKALQKVLREHFQTVVMTGSGTAFFCLEGDPVPIEGISFFPFRSIQRSIPKQPEESGIWQGGSSKFSSVSDVERATIPGSPTMHHRWGGAIAE